MLRARFGPATFAIAAIVAAAVFVRLGVWQIDRLEQRRHANQLRSERENLPVVDLAAVKEWTTAGDSLTWRRVRASGVYEYRSEIVVRGRSRKGSPGVYVLTPLHLASGSSVLVLRGWLPAPDGVSADLIAGRPGTEPSGPSEVDAVAIPGEPVSPIAPRRHPYADGEHLVLGSLSVDQASTGLGLPLLPLVLLPVGGTAERPGAGPPGLWPIQPPAPSEGPHLMYAVQWFGFALIALAGTVVYVNSRRIIVARGGAA